MNTTAKGVHTEAVILQRLIAKGFTVFTPFGGGISYDLVYDNNGSFIRVQCKTGRIRNGVLHFNKADEFGVYCPDNDIAYLIPISVGSWLRIDPPKNNYPNLKYASEFKLA